MRFVGKFFFQTFARKSFVDKIDADEQAENSLRTRQRVSRQNLQ